MSSTDPITVRARFKPRYAPPSARPGTRIVESDRKARRISTTSDAYCFRRETGVVVPLEGAFHGQHLFLLCGGPSAATLPLQRLGERGHMVMAVNNAWLLHRPDLWVGVDPPHRFADSGWLDPRILKFVPACHAHSGLSTWTGTEFKRIPRLVRECPNVVYFSRNSDFNPGTFFTESSVQWGTMRNQPDSLGISNSRSVMLSALKVAHALGFHHVYLLGVDFNMPLSRDQSAYAFDEDKDENGRRANNHMYQTLSRRLSALQDEIVSRSLPFNIYNCNPRSALRCFPFLSFEEALRRSSSLLPAHTPTRGWYMQDASPHGRRKRKKTA